MSRKILTATLVSWETSALGLGVLLTALGLALQAQFDNDPTTNIHFPSLATEIMIALGLIFGRTAWKSSEQSGAGAGAGAGAGDGR